ncbi:MAG: LysE family translocator [Pseudomonadota bacterium]
MDIEVLLLFAATEFLLCLTPGPAVIFVVGLAMRAGTRPGWAAALGVTAGSAFYFALSALGIGALILASHTLFTIIKWVGAAYLIVLGVRMAVPLIRDVRRNGLWRASAPAELAVLQPPAAAQGFWRPFAKGFALQLANPKTLMFFLALFPQFISPEGNVALQFALMALVSALIELPTLMLYALLSAASARFLADRFMLWLEGAAGGVLVFIGGALAIARDR